MGGGGEREAGEERAGGGTRVESRTNRGKLRNNASHFTIDIGPNGENHRYGKLFFIEILSFS